MTDKISVLVPSRNESYLNQTLQSCFDNAAGEIEVVVTLEGYWPSDWKDITARYPNLHTVHHGEPRGLRAAINSAAASAISRGARYLLKLDAHCMLDQGFDEKLKADMQDNWIVVPRRKRLDAEKWQIQDVGKPDIDYHYLSFPDDPNDFGGPGLNGKVWEERARERAGKPEYEIDDEMSSQGSCWFMTADYFQQLELMDEASYGPFWNEAQELFLKCWLSGGRGVINKKTWYAHLHKGKDYKGTTGKSGRGYRLDESWLTQGRNHTMKWLYNEAWAKQTLPFKWLIEHFSPVPGWPEDWEARVYAERKPRAVGPRIPLAIDTPRFDKFMSENPDVDILGGVHVKRDDQGVKADDYAAGGLVIHSADYGPFDHVNPIDVTERIRSLVQNDNLDLVVSNSTVTPDSNPFRGQKKYLYVTYSYDGGEKVTVTRAEKDWLIIGQAKDSPTETFHKAVGAGYAIAAMREAELVRDREGKAKEVHMPQSYQEAVIAKRPAVYVPDGVNTLVPTTPAALNDYLIRKFSISDRRLRAPMPIELPNFHRNDLAQLFAELGFKRGAEIGVAEGHYSEIVLKANPQLESLLLVDPWTKYSDNPRAHSEEHQQFSLNETKRKTAGYDCVRIVQDYSMNAVRDVPEDSLDWAYIDGHHGFDWAMCDLIEWGKRVRSGGLLCGDDFYEMKWGGVVEAVQAYAKAHRIPIWFICDAPRSIDFFWVKP